ncbi:hypothetical protein EYF80_012234 [Liparis tanakae]|uniref:Uncharacterized protein n=1 Tax=Liparis tanakae TaxID=230148 RepID=A0A4Z2IJK8_9TELE|nr:hypothetical protein EYF80_012234 [Liparis tanakae]
MYFLKILGVFGNPSALTVTPSLIIVGVKVRAVIFFGLGLSVHIKHRTDRKTPAVLLSSNDEAIR